MLRFLTLQPSFEIELPVSPEMAFKQMQTAIEHPSLWSQTAAAGRCIDYSIAKEDKHFWSPHLSVQIDELDQDLTATKANADSHSCLHCRFSPRPEVWTMFMATYAVIIATTFMLSVYGYVQFQLGHSPIALVALPVGFVAIVALHAISMFGQSLSVDEMQHLRSNLALTIDLAFGKQHDLKSEKTLLQLDCNRSRDRTPSLVRKRGT